MSPLKEPYCNQWLSVLSKSDETRATIELTAGTCSFMGRYKGSFQGRFKGQVFYKGIGLKAYLEVSWVRRSGVIGFLFRVLEGFIGFYRIQGSYKWGYKSPKMGYTYSCGTYKPHLQLPMNLQALLTDVIRAWKRDLIQKTMPECCQENTNRNLRRTFQLRGKQIERTSKTAPNQTKTIIEDWVLKPFGSGIMAIRFWKPKPQTSKCPEPPKPPNQGIYLKSYKGSEYFLCYIP